MSEAEHPEAPEAPPGGDALPILASDLRITPRKQTGSEAPDTRRGRAASLPAAQVAAAAAGGFVAGAAVIGLVQRRNRLGTALAKGQRRRTLARRSGAAPATAAAAETLQIVSSRTLLLDVHVLGTPRDDS